MSLETITKLATYTVTASGGDSTIVFTNIPQVYTDLYIVVSLRSLYNGWADGYLRFGNGGTTEYKTFKSDIPSGASTETYTVGPTGDFSPYSLGGPNLPANHFNNATIYIPNYTSGSFKTFISEYSVVNSTDDCRVGHAAGIWSNTSPITTATFSVAAGFAQYSSATLYGVKAMRQAVGNSIKATGGAISFDGTYVTHTFNTTDVFTPTTNLLVDYLVVAGGGGGGTAGGGGGAGGLRCTVGATGGGGSLESKLSLASGTGYTVTIGAGGAGTPGGSPYPQASNGNDSVFSTITSTAGGGGGGYSGNGAGRAGGSGGGEGCNSAGGGGSGTANQGYAGGTSAGAGAGGGGAGAVGGSQVDPNPGGSGGVGIQTSISGTATYYAGGGGGAGQGAGAGAGGLGGGGAGGDLSNAGTAGTANTGGGGGSAGNSGSSAGGKGGSGIVIVRYKA